MINADYDLLSITTDNGEKYAFRDKEKMYKFLVSTLREFVKVRRINHGYGEKPFFFKGITK